MERKSCPVCGNERFKEEVGIKYIDLFNGKGKKTYEQKILACDKCNMVWVKNPIEQKMLDNYYKEMSKYETEKIVGKQDASKQKLFKRQNAFINSRIDDYKSVLEIGAATGENLSLYKRQGKAVKGIEPSRQNKEYAKDNYDIEMCDATFNEYYKKYGEERYDLVFFSHVLEHIVDFPEFLEKAIRITNKYIFIEVPFLESMGIGMEPYGLFFYEHVNFFSIASLKTIMQKLGCSLVADSIELNEGGESPGYPTLVMLWRKGTAKETGKKCMDSSRKTASEIMGEYMQASELEFKRVKETIDGITPDKKLAIWGTGSHTSRLLGMTDLGNKNIVKFYDSDRKKQGLTMLGKKIEPFRKEDVEAGIVDTILISSYASEKAIEKAILSQNIEAPLRIICLY